MIEKDLYEASKKSSHEIPAKCYFLKEIYASRKLNINSFTWKGSAIPESGRACKDMLLKTDEPTARHTKAYEGSWYRQRGAFLTEAPLRLYQRNKFPLALPFKIFTNVSILFWSVGGGEILLFASHVLGCFSLQCYTWSLCTCLGCSAVIWQKYHSRGMVCTASGTNAVTCTCALISAKVPCGFQEFTGQGNVQCQYFWHTWSFLDA